MPAKRCTVENGIDERCREPAIRPGNRPGGFVAGYCVTSDIRAVDTATDCLLPFSGPDGDDGDGASQRSVQLCKRIRSLEHRALIQRYDIDNHRHRVLLAEQ